MRTINREQTSWALPFFTIWTGQALSRLGSRMAAFALIWWMTKTTGSATVLATGSLAAYLPHVVLGPFVGALIDRWNRRLIMMVADTVVALTIAGLAILFWTDSVQIWHIYGVALISSLGGAFQGTAMEVSTTLMVPDRHLSRVQGANQTLLGALSIGGPPLGALLLAVLPIHQILGLDIVTAALAVIPLFFIRIPQPQTGKVDTIDKPSLWAEVKSGSLYIWNWPGLRYFLLIGASVNFFANAGSALIPLLVSDHFGGDALQLGWLQAAFGTGVLSGGLVLTVWGGFQRRIYTSLFGSLLSVPGAFMLGLAPQQAFRLAWGGMFITGIASGLNNGAFRALMQANVTPQMQGRVLSVLGSGFQTTTMLGLMVVGPLADFVGSVQFWFVIEGGYTLAMLLVMFLTPAIIHIEDWQPVAQSALIRHPLTKKARLWRSRTK